MAVTTFPRHHRLAASGFYLWILFIAPAFAQETALAWKLKSGERFKVVREQQTVSHTTVASKPVRTSVETTVSMTWEVTAVNDEAAATIIQSLDRIVVNLDAGNGIIAFDSSATGKPTGVVKTLADGVAPLVGGTFEVTMTPRGEITDVQPSDQLAKLFDSKSKKEDAGKQAFSTQGIAKLLQQPLILLPEDKVAVGGTWEMQRDLPSTLGTLKQTLTYKFAGPGKDDQANIARIELAGTIAAPMVAAGAPQLKANELTGTAQFDIEAGRLVQMTARQTLEVTTVFANTPLGVKTESKVTTRLDSEKR